MRKYRLKIGGDPIEFTSTSPEGFIDAWRMEHRSPDPDQAAWIKTAAALACDWSGKPVRYETLDVFTEDMMRHGMLEVIDAK